MKKKKIIQPYKAKTHEYLIALFYYPTAVELVKPKDKIQESLVKWFLNKKEHVPNDSYDLPTIGGLGKELGVTTSVINRHLRQLYDDIYELNQNQPDLFKKPNELLCHFGFKYQGNCASFSAGLSYLPHVGDSFSFFFIKPIIGASQFWVKRIYHSFNDDGQRVTIMLSMDFPNSYLDLIREKAYLRREISFSELLNSEIDYELQEKLMVLNRDNL